MTSLAARPRAFDELGGLPELAAYQDQPAQQPAGAPGKNAFLHLRFGIRGDHTELTGLDRRTPLLAQRALYFDEGMPDMACVFMISTSGGIVQGDRYRVIVDVEDGARAHVTSQSATKVQEMDANYATLTQEITVGESSYLEFLPDPVIPYRHSRFASRTRLTVPASATVLFAEVLMPGRKYYTGRGASDEPGEIFAYDVYSADIQARRPAGNQLFAEKILIEPGSWHPARAGVMGGFHVLGNVLLLTPGDVFERVLPQVPVVPVGDNGGDACGVSRLPNDAGLIFKVLGADCEPVRTRIRQLWTIVRREVTGLPVPEPFGWRR